MAGGERDDGQARGQEDHRGKRHYRQRQGKPRKETVRFRATKSEHEEISAAARRNDATISFYVAWVTLKAAREDLPIADSPAQAMLRELVEISRHVRKIGVNLNQAVTKVNATGQRSDDVATYLAILASFLEHLEAVMRRLDDQLRRQ